MIIIWHSIMRGKAKFKIKSPSTSLVCKAHNNSFFQTEIVLVSIIFKMTHLLLHHKELAKSNWLKMEWEKQIEMMDIYQRQVYELIVDYLRKEMKIST